MHGTTGFAFSKPEEKVEAGVVVLMIAQENRH
jgi:hypothetical protein